jgi:hypothetical protein
MGKKRQVSTRAMGCVIYGLSIGDSYAIYVGTAGDLGREEIMQSATIPRHLSVRAHDADDDRR